MQGAVGVRGGAVPARLHKQCILKVLGHSSPLCGSMQVAFKQRTLMGHWEKLNPAVILAVLWILFSDSSRSAKLQLGKIQPICNAQYSELNTVYPTVSLSSEFQPLMEGKYWGVFTKASVIFFKANLCRLLLKLTS